MASDKEETMKEIHCGEFIAGCPHVSRGATTEELMEAVRVHARGDHGLTEIPEDLKAELLKAIREVED
jgi:predicted small metal-binding protein